MPEIKEDKNTYCLRCDGCQGVAVEPIGQCVKWEERTKYKQFIGKDAVAEFITFSSNWERVFDGVYCTSCAKNEKTKNEKQWQKKQEDKND